VFEDRVLRTMSVPAKDEVTGEWRRLHHEELHNLLLTKYYSHDQIKKKEMGGACGTYGDRRGAYRVLVRGDVTERDHL
jgi:hypothetical protein